MISEHDIEAFLQDAEDDARVMDEIEDRLKLGVTKHREATTEEWLKAFRAGIRFRDACAALIAEKLGAGNVSMSIHSNGERKPCSGE